jgi:RNA polymerase sigma factor (sigma-70 family)
MSSPPAKDWTNARLIERCLDGNEQAWNVLVDRYKNLIYSIPIRYGAPRQDAADIFQAVCLDLFNELARLREAEALQGWLIRVTTHKCYQWKRQQRSESTDWEGAGLDALAADGSIPPDVLDELERQQMIRDAIDSLPWRCREMIELLFFEQPPIPYAEVARRLNIATGSIGFIRGRCLKRLKEVLEKRGF